MELATHGYCRPQEDGKSGEGAMDNSALADPSEGTGLGSADGSGAKDISNEIEAEEQMEGLQGDADEEQQELDKSNAAGLEGGR